MSGVNRRAGQSTTNMIEKHFFADPETPFHVWVRERCGAQGYRWVLRDASKLLGSAARSAPARGASASSAGTGAGNA